MNRIRIKICCISSIYEAQLAVRYGASALGFVSEMPSGPGVIPEERITELVATVPPAVSSFLLTSRQDTNEIVAQQKRCGTNTIQLCDRLLKGNYNDLHKALPGIAIVQVIHVSGEESVKEAITIAPHVNGILLDSGNQALKVKELGGTGRTHNWSISKKIVDSVGIPVFLAGGLNPENVRDAIEQVRPFAVDVCSGVRTNGRLDEIKLAKFCEQVVW